MGSTEPEEPEPPHAANIITPRLHRVQKEIARTILMIRYLCDHSRCLS
jgi:hypothetical protein